ncbi:DUF4381 [Desulfonema limicola]|uniref:DUF4381 n=1 Tax=Desulfonema limicola TaxID=45656 RepID=A0A975GI01_9BACT|nr:DUF4381 [Desulfonema limicola]
MTIFSIILFFPFLIIPVLPVKAQQQPESVTPVQQPQEPDVMTNIHDIKPPEPAGFDPALLWYVLIAVIAIALILLLVFLWKKRKKRIKHSVAASLLPEEAALLALDELLDIENIDGKDFYFRLSLILRHYINDRYEINAPEMTTEELVPKMDRLGIDKKLVQSLKELFHTADPVKFAGIYPVASRMESDLAFGRKFVKETTPKEEPGEDK